MPEKPETIRYLGLAGVAGPVLFTLAWVVSSAIQDDYSVRREYVSALAGGTADAPWLMILGFIVAGVGVLALAPALHRSVAGGTGKWAGPAPVAIAGVFTIAAGFLRYDCSPGTAACDALIDAGDVSASHDLHEAAALIVFVALALAPLVMWLRFRGDPRWASLRTYSLITAPVVVVLIVLFGGEVVESWNGVVQRLLVTVMFLWVAVVGWRVYQLHSEWAEAVDARRPESRP